MTLIELGKCWNVTPAERAAQFACDALMDGRRDVERWLRAVNIDAPVEVIYRWMCQFAVAPHSYDWIDNLGRRSPRH